jgi:hypothetical protein
MSPKPWGIISAAKAPWSTRATISTSGDSATAQPTEAAMKPDDADHQHPSAAKYVAQSSAGEQPHGHGQGVTSSDPLQHC